MRKKIILNFIFVAILSISTIVFSQIRRSKQDEFTISQLSINENELISHSIRVCDADGDIVSIKLENAPGGMTFGEVYEITEYIPPDPNICQECVDDENSSWYALDIEWTPTHDQIGSHKIYIHAEDDKGGDDWVNYIIIVNSINRPPVL